MVSFGAQRSLLKYHPPMTFEALTNWSIHSNQNTALNKKMHMDLQSGLY